MPAQTSKVKGDAAPTEPVQDENYIAAVTMREATEEEIQRLRQRRIKHPELQQLKKNAGKLLSGESHGFVWEQVDKPAAKKLSSAINSYCKSNDVQLRATMEDCTVYVMKREGEHE